MPNAPTTDTNVYFPLWNSIPESEPFRAVKNLRRA